MEGQARTEAGLATWGDAFNGVQGEMALQKAYAHATDFHQLIYRLSGRPPFMLGRDVAAVYGVSTERLMQQARRNMDLANSELLFELTRQECETLRLQNASALVNQNLPYGFTQLGANKIAFYLKSEVAQERSTQILKAFIHFEEMHNRGELPTSAGNIGQGLMLSNAIQNQGLTLSDVAAICWFRQRGLSQKEVGVLMGSTQWKIQGIEGVLSQVGVKFKPVNAQARAAEMWRGFSRLMGFKSHVLPLLKGGAA